jgi:hypothetical protein
MPYGYGSANKGPSGPAGGASAGGNYGGNRNPQQTYGGRSTPVPTGGPPGGGDPGMTYKKPPVTTAGGPPGILNPQPFNYGKFRKDTAKNTLWGRWQRHKMMSNLMKEGKVKDYHQLGAHDFTQRFDVPEWLSKGLATTYQYASELGRQIIPVNKNNIYTAIGEDLKKDKPFEPLGAVIGSISNALDRAKEESRLGYRGIEGLTGPQQEVYDQYAKMFNPTLKKMYKAQGGIVDLYRYGGF